jgi:hypothetical protein
MGGKRKLKKVGAAGGGLGKNISKHFSFLLGGVKNNKITEKKRMAGVGTSFDNQKIPNLSIKPTRIIIRL